MESGTSLSLTLTWFNGLNGYLDQSAEKGTSWQQNQSTLAITKLTPSFYENVGYLSDWPTHYLSIYPLLLLNGENLSGNYNKGEKQIPEP